MKYVKFAFLFSSALLAFNNIPIAAASPIPFEEIHAAGALGSKMDAFLIEMQPCAANGKTSQTRFRIETASAGGDTEASGYDTGKGEALYTAIPPITGVRSTGEGITILKIWVQLCLDNSTPAVRISSIGSTNPPRVFGNPTAQQAFLTDSKIIYIPTENFDIKLDACINGDFAAMTVNGIDYLEKLKDNSGQTIPMAAEEDVPDPVNATKTVSIIQQKCANGQIPKYEFINLRSAPGKSTTGGKVSTSSISIHGGIIPNCNPALPPGTPYDKDEKDPTKIPCGVNKFIELLQNIIKYLSLLVIPIAVLMIGWGGFQILTSAGSEEKLGAGKKAIITAITGIVIILISYVIIKFVFDALGVDPAFRGSLFK